MTLKHAAHRAVDSAIRGLPLKRLPSLWNGTMLWLTPENWVSVYARYEPAIATVFRRYLRRGDLMIDVGAHAGLWSLFAARIVGPAGRVIACEPSGVYDTLVRQARAYPQIVPRRIGISSTPGEAMFYGQPGTSSGSFNPDVTAINTHYSPEPVQAYSVPILPLESVVGDGTPRLIKIDVEGYEGRVLDGMGRLWACRPVLIIEVHPPQLGLCGDSPEQVLERLTALGYAVTVIDRNPNGLFTVLATADPA